MTAPLHDSAHDRVAQIDRIIRFVIEEVIHHHERAKNAD